MSHPSAILSPSPDRNAPVRLFLAHSGDLTRIPTRGGPQRKVLGFLTGGITGRAAVLDLGEDFTLSGVGPTLGGGVSVFLNPSLALEAGLLWTLGDFTEAEYKGRTEDVDIGATSARFDLGVSWWAGR